MKSSKINSLAIGILLIILSLTTLFALQASKLEFDYDFESFFPENDPDLSYYSKLNESFGLQNDFLFLALKNIDLKDSSVIKSLFELERKLEAQDEISDVESIFDESIYQITPFGTNKTHLLNPSKSIDINSIPESLKVYLGKDGRSVLFIVRHLPFSEKESGDQFHNSLKRFLSSNSDGEYELSGKIQMQSDFTRLLESELKKLLLVSSIMVVVLLLALYRSIKGLIFPIFIIFCSVIWIIGIMVLMNKQVDVMIIMLPVILVILSLSDVIHLVNKYDYFLDENQTPKSALINSFKTVGKATFITSITTAIGFASLYFLPIKPIKDFGLYAASGVLITYILTFTILPSLLIFFPKKVGKSRFDFSSILGDKINTSRYSIPLTIILTIVLVSGTFLLKRNTGLIVGLQKEEPMLKQVAFFDNNFQGYRPFELAVETTDLFEMKNLYNLENLEEIIEKVYQVESVYSPLTIIRKINSGLYGGSSSKLVIPLEKDLTRVRRIYHSKRLINERAAFDNQSGLIRMVANTKDLGSDRFRELNATFNAEIKKIATEHFNPRLTGTSFLIDKTDDFVIDALLKGLAFAITCIGLIMFIIYRNLKVTILVLLVNIVPLLSLFGIMGWLSIELNIATAVIFTVALGIAVDDSIHFVARFMHLINEGYSVETSIEETKKSTGYSIIITSLIMIGGFLTLLVSGFSTVYFLGLFIILIAILALWYDLKILPMLLSKFV